MCGISGIIGPKATKTNIGLMTDAMIHLGNNNISHFIDKIILYIKSNPKMYVNIYTLNDWEKPEEIISNQIKC